MKILTYMKYLHRASIMLNEKRLEAFPLKAEIRRTYYTFKVLKNSPGGCVFSGLSTSLQSERSRV